MLRCYKNKNRQGYTLIEILVTLTIVGILSAIIVPSTLAFLETGKQTNRYNIARTIYLAAQNQLTEKRILNSLESFSESFYDVDGEVNNDETTMVYKILGDTFEDSAENSKYVRFISKPKGNTDPNHPVMKLLDPVVLDKIVLNDAILIEYNIKTGIVLSAFYGDMIDEFQYGAADINSNVTGIRPYTYTIASERKQGYYGVSETGTIPEVMEYSINIKDGYSAPLTEPFATYKNVLYAEMLIPERMLEENADGDSPSFSLKINGIEAHNVQLGRLDKSTSLQTVLEHSLPALPGSTGTPLIYRTDDGSNPKAARFIWVIDYVGSDMTDAKYSKHQIKEKYGALLGSDLAPEKNLRVSISGNGVDKTSFTEANPYFYTENPALYGGGKNRVGSARHLNNVRFSTDGYFTQIDSDPTISGNNPIDMSEITKFVPIADYKGTYNGMGLSIDNLKIDVASDYVGLFSKLEGKLYAIALNNAVVNGTNYVGTVAGSVSNNAVISGAYLNGCAVTGTGHSIGGFAGENFGQINDSSFLSISQVSPIAGDINGGSVNVGGVTGVNNTGGKLIRLFYLAVAPAKDEIIYPITGKENDTPTANVKDVYYLHGISIRPTIDTFYMNLQKTNGVGVGKDTPDSHAMMFNNWNKHTFTEVGEELLLRLISDENEFYPYPYFINSGESIARDKSWPIAFGGEITADITVDGWPLVLRDKFNMYLPATTKMSYDRSSKLSGGPSGAFDSTFDTDIIKDRTVTSKVVSVTNSSTIDSFVNFEFDEMAKTDNVMWCIIPEELIVEAGEDYSSRQLVFDRLLKANPRYTADEVKKMTTTQLAAALTEANAVTMADEKYSKIPAKIEAEKPEDEQKFKKQYVVLYWLEDNGTYKKYDIDKKFVVTMKDANAPPEAEPTTKEERIVTVFSPTFDVEPFINRYTPEKSVYELSRSDYVNRFNLSLTYTGHGMTYSRIKIVEEWLDKDGNIVSGASSNYTYSPTTPVFDNRHNDGYLYTKSPIKGNLTGAKLPVITKSTTSLPSEAVKVKVSVFVDSVQFNLPYELWEIPKLPWA